MPESAEQPSIDDIIEVFARPGDSPRAAIEAAEQHREEVTRRVLAAFEEYFNEGEVEDRVFLPWPILIGAYVLAEWRVTALFAPLMKALRLPSDEVEALFSDAVTSTLHRVVASVYDGDAEPIFAAIADPKTDQFVAEMLCKALVALVANDALPRETVADFVRARFAERRPASEEHNFYWLGLASLVAALQMEDLKPQVLLAHTDGRIGEHLQSYGHFEEDWRAWAGGPSAPPADEEDSVRYWQGSADYFDGWSWYGKIPESEADLDTEGDGDGIADEDDVFAAEKPVVAKSAPNPYRDVGRNDPCPCGSGKKFKKCCLAKAEAWG